ncbi:hypothetical protein [Thalassospira alkalitolerans]|uniref:hypothetical protein n=1 Tax=Thalassospira alkalitolerans TaxID=1293890 RepID=UPI003AA8FE7B
MHKPKTGRLIIHVGDHKLESTELQTALATQRVSLVGQSLYYPGNSDHTSLYHQWKQIDASTLNTLSRGIQNVSADVTILSGEWLEDAPARFLKSVLDSHLAATCEDYKIITYVRPHAARFIATRVEQIKSGFHPEETLDQFFERSFANKRFFYAPRYTDWHCTFNDAFVVRPLIEAQLQGGSIVTDFITTVADGRPFEVAEMATTDPKLNLRDLMVLKLVHRRTKTLDRADHIGLGRSIARHMRALGNFESEPLRIHKSLAEAIAKAYREDAQAMDRLLFGGKKVLETELDRAIETALPQPQSLRPADHLSADERRTILALADMVHEVSGNGKNWNVHFRKAHAAALAN